MTEIKRFDMRGNTWPSDDGSIVSYKDHAAIVAALQEQVRALAAEVYMVKEAIEHHAACEANCPRCGWAEPCVTDDVVSTVRDISTPDTDAALREFRAQARAEGIHFAANRLLAAWESGFIDDTPAAAHDISGAILSAVEFLPNADEGEFKRDYADEVRATIKAGEKS